MAGTKNGAMKTRETNYEKYGLDFYAKIGAEGGSAPYKGKKGFAANKELARSAGSKGGKNRWKGKES